VDEAHARLADALVAAGEQLFEIRTGGPVGGPSAQVDEIFAHVDAGCAIYGGMGWTAEGLPIFYVGGGSGQPTSTFIAPPAPSPDRGAFRVDRACVGDGDPRCGRGWQPAGRSPTTATRDHARAEARGPDATGSSARPRPQGVDPPSRYPRWNLTRTRPSTSPSRYPRWNLTRTRPSTSPSRYPRRNLTRTWPQRRPLPARVAAKRRREGPSGDPPDPPQRRGVGQRVAVHEEEVGWATLADAPGIGLSQQLPAAERRRPQRLPGLEPCGYE
jgi:hypothetical protein